MIDECLMMYARTMARDQIMHSMYLKNCFKPSVKASQTKLTNKIYKELVERQKREGLLGILIS